MDSPDFVKPDLPDPESILRIVDLIFFGVEDNTPPS